MKSNCDFDAFKMLYIDEHGMVSMYNEIPITTSDGGYVLNLTKYLDSNGIFYEFLDKHSVSWDTLLNVWYCGISQKPYGAICDLPSDGITLDGTGSGYKYFFNDSYFSFGGVSINGIKIHFYSVDSMYEEINSFLEQHHGKLTDVLLSELLEIICRGNEICVQTNHMSIIIYRH